MELTQRVTHPQGDGADRPFDGLVLVQHIGTMPDGDPLDCYRVVSKAQPSVEDMLVQSIQSQALNAAGEVWNAINRACFLDLIKAWTRLLKISGVELSLVRDYRSDWTFDQLGKDVAIALCYAEMIDTPAGRQTWARVDAQLRAYAMRAAHALESRWSATDTEAKIARENAAKYRAFAEGRA